MRAFYQRLMARLHREEDGTSLTEFAIMLPIFVVLLTFITYMGYFGSYMTEEWNQAQRDLWYEVRADQELGHVGINANDPAQWDADPQRAGEKGLSDLSDEPPRPWPESLQAGLTNHEQDMLRGMRDGGHWGESHGRTRPADSQVNFFIDSEGSWSVTNNPGNIIGGSGYAAGLVDDRSGTPIEYEVNRGLPMVVAAGMRYGVIQVVREAEVEFASGWSKAIKAEYNVLVPPRPPPNAGQWARDVTRNSMENYQPYSSILGIANEQPVRGASAPSVPNL